MATTAALACACGHLRAWRPGCSHPVAIGGSEITRAKRPHLSTKGILNGSTVRRWTPNTTIVSKKHDLPKGVMVRSWVTAKHILNPTEAVAESLKLKLCSQPVDPTCRRRNFCEISYDKQNWGIDKLDPDSYAFISKQNGSDWL